MKNSNTTRVDYTGKVVFVGLDVHKKSYSVSCICEGELVKKATLKGNPEEFVKFLEKFFRGAKIKSAYETGFSGFHLHRFLIQRGIENLVVHAASIEVSARDRVKTDKRDSLKIATQLASGRLRGVHVPSEEREAFRSVSRLRETLLGDRTRAGLRIKSLLYTQGLISEDEEKVSKKWIEKVMNYEIHPELKYTIQSYGEQWLSLNSKIKEIDKHLEKQAEADIVLETIYRSSPGIGKINGRELCNELEDMSQFSNEKKVYSFTGLTPSEDSSGEHRRQGHISRQGRSVLRKILIQAAWFAIRKDEELKAIFERVSQKAGKKRAIIGIARRLIGRIRSCILNGCLYQTQTAQ
jgi:transposase